MDLLFIGLIVGFILGAAFMFFLIAKLIES